MASAWSEEKALRFVTERLGPDFIRVRCACYGDQSEAREKAIQMCRERGWMA